MPRWVRMLFIAFGSVMLAMVRNLPPQRGRDGASGHIHQESFQSFAVTRTNTRGAVQRETGKLRTESFCVGRLREVMQKHRAGVYR